jgi:hypothetical protein
MTRLWPDGTLIQVVQSSPELPGRFTWQGQIHPIEAISKRWRVQMEWWREGIHRDYFKLTTTTGLLVVIFHDLHTGHWYLQRLYD